mgnify:CR=1 FL=1
MHLLFDQISTLKMILHYVDENIVGQNQNGKKKSRRCGTYSIYRINIASP